MQVWTDKMASLTLGSKYGAVIKKARQEGQREDDAQGAVSEGPYPG
jgi:hypothetical protein